MAPQTQTREQPNPDSSRIRNNQRRSRARRKEYLQELEVKYRHCEQTGVEAAAEIQAAARRVLEENRRLRGLLRQHGVTDVAIDGDAATGSAASALEALLHGRRRCGDGTASVSSRGPVGTPRVSPAVQASHTASPAVTSSITETTPSITHPHTPKISSPGPSQPDQDAQGPPPLLEQTKDTTDATGTTSCLTAASIIRGLRPSLDDYALEASLGCAGRGEECVVANSFVLQEMDRWTEG